ncbi:alpha-L-rhamnosidase N-terminal domain-containing protein, partial [Robinsoniella sp.]
MKAIKLKTERLVNPLGIDIKQPSLSWICQDGITQTAYEIEAVSDGCIIWKSGKVSTNKMQVIFGEVLESKQRVSWKVRLWDEADTVGEWSEEAFFEAGILDAAQFVAKWINPELVSDPCIHMPASYLQTTFKAPLGSQARLYITCHGLYEAYLNGLRVGDFVLAPGSDTYNKKLTYQTYDVTELVKEGKNDVQVILGDGWYRSCSGVDGERNLFGEDIALYFQLEVDGVPVCISDEKWQATQDGPIRENDMQQGE